MKIENYNFVIPYFIDDNELNYAYIPQPNKILFDSVSSILGYFYTKIRSGNLLPEVFVMDYEAICDEIIEQNNLNPNTKTKLNNFLEKMLISSNLIDDKLNIVNFNDVKLDDETLTIIKGYALFISALFRYTPAQIRMSVLGQLITSQEISAYINSLKKQSTEQSMEKEDTTIKKPRQEVRKTTIKKLN